MLLSIASHTWVSVKRKISLRGREVLFRRLQIRSETVNDADLNEGTVGGGIKAPQVITRRKVGPENISTPCV